MGWISTMSSLHSASCLARSGVRQVIGEPFGETRGELLVNLIDGHGTKI